MPSIQRLGAIAMMPLIVLLAGCVSTTIANDVPACERLIPRSLIDPTPAVDLPVSAKLADGHDDARPWQAGFLGQTGQLEKSNEKAPAVDHIYRGCLELHRAALAKSKRGFFGRIFG